MSAEGQIDYDALVQDAMRSVVRTVLLQVVKDGLPGEHHFFISFYTGSPGVVLSKRLKEKYPHEMTIVLQHRFWDLFVHDDRFEVKLTFDAIPERLVIPFAALKVFIDPSVRFGHQFEDLEALAAARAEADQGGDGSPVSDISAGGRGSRSSRNDGSRNDGSRTERKPRAATARKRPVDALSPATETPNVVPMAETTPKLTEAEPVAAPSTQQPVPSSGSKVVSLDQFRKK